MALVALALPIACMWLALRVVLPSSAATRAGLSISVGLGAAASLAILPLACVRRMGWAFVAADAAVWLTLLAASILLTRRHHAPTTEPRAIRTHSGWTSLLFPALAGLNGVILILAYVKAPQGAWDGWAIWNLRARFLFRADDWHEAVTPALAFPHPDYPLLLPTSIARLWAWNGAETAWIPPVVAALCGAATLLVLIGALQDSSADRNVGGLALLAGGPWVWEVLSQCADIPLGLSSSPRWRSSRRRSTIQIHCRWRSPG